MAVSLVVSIGHPAIERGGNEAIIVVREFRLKKLSGIRGNLLKADDVGRPANQGFGLMMLLRCAVSDIPADQFHHSHPRQRLLRLRLFQV